MKILLDTNIIIHREANRVINDDIGQLFFWIDKIQSQKFIHPITVEELNRHNDPKVVRSMGIKLNSYNQLKTIAPLSESFINIVSQIDNSINDEGDSKLLNEVYSNRVDLLISEDKKIHIKARLLGIEDKVFSIESFLEKVVAENPDLIVYKVLSVQKVYFGQVDINAPFFNSFKDDYKDFENWFNRKSDESAYVCYQNNVLQAFLYVKVETEDENYSNLTPMLTPNKRLKIGTFKVSNNGFKIGERFLKIIFDNALKQKVQEIYVTIFDRQSEQKRLIELLEKWGFVHYGIKNTKDGEEQVYIKNFSRTQKINLTNPKLTYPFISRESSVFLVPIKEEYHTNLFPDSILRTESPRDFVENEPHRNALSKVYISGSHERGLLSGDIIVFYRTGGYFKSVVTTIGVVESLVIDIPNEAEFLRLCRKRSVFTDEELKEQWNRSRSVKPFIVHFIYTASFERRPNLKWLIENGIIKDINTVPRGFQQISRESFNKINQYAVLR